MTSVRSILCLLPLGCALACAGTSDDQADDGSSSSASTDASATMTTTTMSTTTMSTSDATTTSPPTTSSTEEGSSSTDAASSSSSDEADGSSSDDDSSSSGGPVNDCTDVKDPCVLDLDAPHDGAGGVDQFFLYTVGDGSEHVQFDGIANDYANWDVAPGGFLCNLMGPCCLSEGMLCDKALNGQGVEFASGDPVYLFVYANAPYTLTITSP
ncbi:MAG TPA: hypothetical protein VG755_30655 [Nannocystaceae bacterium]|nr:hypothetical protein [Nannocystaceae bacterium]